MPICPAGNLEIYYETFGEPSHELMILISGLGGQLISWEQEFIDKLTSIDLWVCAFDNRDSGLSSGFDQKVNLKPASVTDDKNQSRVQRLAAQALYDLYDMADDVYHLLRHLGRQKAHILGVSMGGMIAQCFAIKYPEYTASLCSIMSTTGANNVGMPRPEVVDILFKPSPLEKEKVIEQGINNAKLISSPLYPTPEEKLRLRQERFYERSFRPKGVENQLKAILATPDRTQELKKLDVKALVIHGAEDPLVDLSGGQATAKALKNSKLVVIDGMGHDLPEAIWDLVINEIEDLVKEA
jgi:pimeloyl-ACP methyl ester carboxylesterase